MTETTEVFEHIKTYYDDLVSRYGHHPMACDYGRVESQQLKFQVLADVMSLNGKHVLEVGCGFADFADYLNTRFTDVHYTGLEISDRMIAYARELHPSLDIRNCNILKEDVEPSDVVIANGIFYLLGDNAPSLMQALIDRMFRVASQALIFNSLSTRAPAKEDGEFYANPNTTLQFCQSLTPWVVLRHDYMPHDFTIAMFKQQNDRID